ncbi:MAG: hypothetical protein WCX71_00155 [Candidatus Buchananbacteria bacterium]
MKKSLIIFVFAAMLLSGCTLQLGGSNTPTVAGVYKSVDSGVTWQAKNLFLHSKGVGQISGVNVSGLTFDPSDRKALYINSDTAGLLYSYDSADSWMKANGIGNAKIYSVAIDPKDRCTIYATYNNTIIKSSDCNRSWTETYLDARAEKLVTALAVGLDDSKIIYAGNNAGEVLKSSDAGATWQTINRVGDQIVKIMVDPFSPQTIYFATKSKGIFKAENAGLNWVNINNELKSFSGALEYKSLIFDLSQPNSLILAAKYGLLKTTDGGLNWEPIKLITPAGATDIYSVAVNPKNNQEIYYSTATTFYKSTDGGVNWVTKRLPTNTAGTAMLIDPSDPKIIYLGFSVIAKK